jgi:8-oxo-dGTP pyrophosphatase MutT (NUDIX family)
MKAEQLSLPRFEVPHRGPIAVFIGFKDIETDDPKILLAKRPSGRYTLPGGKSKFCDLGKPQSTAIRETREETGWKIFDSEYLISPVNSPVKIAADGFERDMYLFYGFTDECMENNVPEHREPSKNTPWEWISVRKIPYLVATGEMHPVILKADLESIIEDAHEVCIADFQPVKKLLDK